MRLTLVRGPENVTAPAMAPPRAVLPAQEYRPRETLLTPPSHPSRPVSGPIQTHSSWPASPSGERAQEHLDAAIEQLAVAAQAHSMRAQGDAMMLGIEHAARAFCEAFDADTTRLLLGRIAEGLKSR